MLSLLHTMHLQYKYYSKTRLKLSMYRKQQRNNGGFILLRTKTSRPFYTSRVPAPLKHTNPHQHTPKNDLVHPLQYFISTRSFIYNLKCFKEMCRESCTHKQQDKDNLF